MHLVSKAWILFFRVSKQDLCFTAIEEDERGKRLTEHELACKADGVAPLDPVHDLTVHCHDTHFHVVSPINIFRERGRGERGRLRARRERERLCIVCVYTVRNSTQRRGGRERECMHGYPSVCLYVYVHEYNSTQSDG